MYLLNRKAYLNERYEFQCSIARVKILERLSGSKQQRVAIAKVLANDPAVILADESTANINSKINSKTEHGVIELLCKVACEHGKSIII